VAEALQAGLVEELLVAKGARSTPGLRSVLTAAGGAGIAVEEAGRDRLDGIALDHQGVAARVRRPRTMSEADLLDRPVGPGDVYVVLDGVTDPHNLGAAARAAEAAGVSVLVIRERRSAGITPVAIRSSAGALLHLPVAVVTNLRRTIDRLRERDLTVVGLDGDASNGIYDEPAPDGPLALVVGSEGEGLSRLVREGCDRLVALPMRGSVDSLNASAALAAALFGYVLPSRS
jgi:23S rRNA (guanosine2251-2'-O)-methyltransferase